MPNLLVNKIPQGSRFAGLFKNIRCNFEQNHWPDDLWGEAKIAFHSIGQPFQAGTSATAGDPKIFCAFYDADGLLIKHPDQ
jgi:hypothetical protein